MADQDAQQAQSSLASTFPNPPPFWREFTPQNISQIDELRSAALASQPSRNGIDRLTLRLEDLPPELMNLQPPPVPVDGRWRVFSDQYTLDDKLPTLEDQGIERLTQSLSLDDADKDGKHFDRAFELKKLAKSLLLKFLELVGTLSIAPEQGRDEVQDLSKILINFHHILNEYRPHQARESAIAMLQTHLDQTRAETAAISAETAKARQVLESLDSIEVPPPLEPEEPAATDEDENEHEAGRRNGWMSADGRF